MLIEILTGRRPTYEFLNENMNLRQWVSESFPSSLKTIVDENICLGENHEICIYSMMELALECTKERQEERVNMKDVVNRLNKIKEGLSVETKKKRT